MADIRMTPNTNGLLYGIIGALLVVVVAGGFYLYGMDSPASSPPLDAAKPAAPVPAPPPVATPRPTPSPAPPAGPSATQLNQARSYIADARRFAAAGDFAGAETSLQAADAAVPGFAETAAARREIAAMRTARGQLGPLLNQARRAVERGDFVAADRALDEAEKIDANAPEVIDARRDLRAAQRQAERPDSRQSARVLALVTAARAAISLGDFTSADRALDEAERIDPHSPVIRNVRVELQDAARRPRQNRN